MLSSSKKSILYVHEQLGYNQYCDGKCLTLALRIGVQDPWFMVITQFSWLKYFYRGQFWVINYWYHWMSSLKEVHTVGPVLRVQKPDPALTNGYNWTTVPIMNQSFIFYKRCSFPLWHLPLMISPFLTPPILFLWVS